MTTITIKGLLASKLRLALTALAIVLGVAFVSGSFVFTDTIEARFETLFDDVYSGVDVTVRPVTDELGEPGSLDESIVEEVRDAEGVAVADAGVAGTARIISPDGEPLGTMGPPNLGFSWGSEPSLNPLRIEEGNGRPPSAAGEVVIDVATAEANDLGVGDVVGIQAAGPAQDFEVVGLANFGSEDNLAGATLAAFEYREAQRLFDLGGRVSYVDVQAADGMEAEALAADLSAAFGPRVETVTGDDQTAEELEEFTEAIGFLTVALLAFAAVAVFVGAYIIQNTFRIVVAQRSRQLALLRAVGATRRQITRMVVVEALVVGTAASAVGIVAGIGLSAVLKSAMDAIGLGVPDGPLTVEPRTVVVGMAVGVVVTVVSALLPARRASKVAPVEAMRRSSAEPRRSLRGRALAGGGLVALGAGGVAAGLVADGGVAAVGAGAAVAFVGISTLAPLFAAPLAGAAGRLLPGVTASLATGNTARQPRRTASTASALMIGIALVAFVSIFAASVEASVETALDGALGADVTVVPTGIDAEVSEEAVAELADVEDLSSVSPIVRARARVDGRAVDVAGVDQDTIREVYDPAATVDIAAFDGLLVAESVAETNGWSVGDRLDVEYAGGRVVSTEVAGTFTDPMFGQYLVPAEALGDAPVATVLADAGPGVDVDEAVIQVEEALGAYPSLDVMTVSDQIDQARSQIDQMVALFTGLLGLAIVIAVLGIANTLALSVVERTREVGLLRAVGLTRRQVRRMVRTEAVLTALFGAVLGLVAGTVLGWAVVASMEGQGLGTFAFPGVQLGVWLVVSALAGVIAAIGPARRAARLDVLRAIAHE